MADAEFVVAAVDHRCAPCKLWPKLQRSRSCEARGHACIGAGLAPHAAQWPSRSVPYHPHVPTGFADDRVPPPFVLPSAFALRCGSGRRPGASEASACTGEGNVNTPGLHARRHGHAQSHHTPDSTMQCTATYSESAAKTVTVIAISAEIALL